MPERVAQGLAFLQDNGIWHLVSENPPVRSCAEAANQRHRLGHVGIPLCDELKSLLYAYEDGSGTRRYVLLNCRGHQRVDLVKVRDLLAAEVLPVRPEELVREFDAEYGAVTPLLFVDRSEVRQIVDGTLLQPFFAPYTLMTNSGDLRHAVEFRAAELFAALPRCETADIVVDEDGRVPRHTLGILTGNSPESGMLLWEKINGRIRADERVRFRADIGFPRLVVESLPDLGASMELSQREADVRAKVLDAVERLCAAGVTVVGVACNTTQYFARDIESICSHHGARFVSLAEATGAHLRRSGITTFDFLGIGVVTDLGGWSDFGQAFHGLDVRLPDRSQVTRITKLAFDVKREVVTPATVNHLRDVIATMTETDTVVLALTELSVLRARLHGKSRSGKHFIDTLDLLAERMAEIYLQERIQTGGA